MAELQLTHIALVGARMSAFQGLGYQARDEISIRRIAPSRPQGGLESLGQDELKSHLGEQLPIWIHNIISDPDFPNRVTLIMPLRRFEGELADNKRDEVVSAVLSSGFRNQDFDPMHLPKEMSMRERVAIVAHLDIWQEAYQALSESVLEILCEQAGALDHWCDMAEQPDFELID
jgi:hypothetical protein